jgi:hypothetical protein
MVHIACLFSAVIVHGTAPGNFLSSILFFRYLKVAMPIYPSVKIFVVSHEVLYSVKNIRQYNVERYQRQLASCELQLGFKRKSSTNLYSNYMVLKETLSYYVNHQTSVFCTFLDASKAFDKIKLL